MGVAAPGARFDVTRLNQGIECLKILGFRVKAPDQIFGQKRYLAGNDQCRAEVIHGLVSDPDIRGIICARGGFGTLRMLPYLDWQLIRTHPKLFIGFSDATALLIPVMQRAGMGVIHGPNLVSLVNAGPATCTAFSNALTGQICVVSIARGGCVVPGRAAGVLVGGNLATLVHLLGTGFSPDFSNGVVFLEDVGEPAYKIDRMLTQMRLAGLFDQIQGVITGTFERCDHPEYLPEILTDIFGEYRIPVLTGLEAGHGAVNLSLPMGCQVRIDTGDMTLRWQHSTGRP